MCVASGSFSFLGVSFNAGERVSRVRITSGSHGIDGSFAGPDSSRVGLDDAVVMDDKDRGARQHPFGGCHAGEGRDSWIAGQARIGGLVGVPLPRERARRFWLRSLLPRVTPFGGKILDSGGFAAF